MMAIAAYYPEIKAAHVTAVCLSLGLFVLRAGWMLADSPQLQRRWVRIVPHIVDSVLLGSAIVLVLIINQYPFVQPWLTAKVLALVVYVVLGSVGLKYGHTRGGRALACAVAVLVFGYIVTVAVAHSPWGPVALWWWAG